MVINVGKTVAGMLIMSVPQPEPIAAYSGNLVAMLSYPARSRPLNTFEDVAKSGFNIVFYGGAVHWQFLTDSSVEAVRTLHKRVMDNGKEFSTE